MLSWEPPEPLGHLSQCLLRLFWSPRFHFRLSEVLRTYLEGQFKIAATDLTFEELRTQLGDLPISDDLREELIRWSQQSELVKFADLRITQEESLQMCDWASKFVRETRPQSEEEKPT